MVLDHFREYLGAEWVHIGVEETLPEHLARLHSIEKAHAVLTSKGVVGYLVHANTCLFIWNDGAWWRGDISFSNEILYSTNLQLSNKVEYEKAKGAYKKEEAAYHRAQKACREQGHDQKRVTCDCPRTPPAKPKIDLKWDVDGHPETMRGILNNNALRAATLTTGSPRTGTSCVFSDPSMMWVDDLDIIQNHTLGTAERATWNEHFVQQFDRGWQPQLVFWMVKLVREGCGEFWSPDGGTNMETFSDGGEGILLERRMVSTTGGTVDLKLQEWWVEAYEGERLGERTPHGRGVERQRDGTEFEGYFWKGRRHGWGILTLLDGQKVMQEYDNGKLVTTRDMGSESQKHFAEVRLHDLGRQRERIGELEAELGRTREALAREKELHKELLVKYRYDTGQDLEARTSAELQAFQQTLVGKMSECVTAANKVGTRESELAARQFTEDLKAAKVAHEKKMLEFQAEMDLQVERLQRKHSEQVAQLEANAAEDQKRLEDLYQNEQKEKETLTAELGQMSAQHKDRLDKLRAQQAEEMASLVKEQKKEVSARKEYYCPITCDVMQDPVVASDGFTYDREAVVNWFQRSSISPMTGATLSDLEVRPNLTLRSAIREWQDQRDPLS